MKQITTSGIPRYARLLAQTARAIGAAGWVLSLSAALLSQPARAASEQKSTTQALSLSAAVKPNPPKTGDNTLDVLLTDASGRPVAGVKLSASVAMTSMDMGTTHPAFKDLGNGHYEGRVSFTMDGPWRVVLRTTSGSKAALDFAAGKKTPWKSPALTLAVPVQPATAPGATPGPKSDATKSDATKSDPTKTDPMGGMAMPGTPEAPNKPGAASDTPAPAASAKPDTTSSMGGGMPGMDMSHGSSGGGTQAHSGMNMKPLKMPQLQEKGAYTATGEEDWKAHTGFGQNAGMVGMMNKMMVGGSGMEGMKMPAMKMKFGEDNFSGDKGDADGSGDMPGMDMGDGKAGGKSGSMPGMKMGGKTDAMSGMGTSKTPPSAPDGGQTPKAPADRGKSSDQSMPGTAMPAPKAGSPAPIPLTVTATTPSPKTGDNLLTITVRDAQGKPVTGAKVTASVAMTSMDMGTTHPTVQEVGSGKYTVTAAFSMAGPWRVKVRVAAPGQNPALKAFDFTAK